jgi:hypothetical protein
MTLRHRHEPGDVPPAVAAHHMGFPSLEAFQAALPALLARKFPPPDETSGNFDLDAIKAWRRARHPHLFPADRLIATPAARDANDVVATRLAQAGSHPRRARAMGRSGG